ncbi:hypothetical protein B9Z55_019578 [Caenorhabditis nigoni]|uniref:Uncharacterized protein n=1 Tax=Caenorhabditis nigoni TaxID=1611254 RepID=A0A2G5TJ29_9PELO|nr:hypothetical protein B9Z55_019578 [Caenorhabditis nigoni]
MSAGEEGSPLFKNGDGLFSTHVHLEDLQKVIGEQMNTKAELGPNTKYTIVGDGIHESGGSCGPRLDSA